MASYLAIARNGFAEIEVKRSRFICRVERVTTEAAARAVVEGIRKWHWDARHNCSAFVLGPDAAVQRPNDDGEPSGTAGAPMLGAGGLVRAYSDAVRLALKDVSVVERRLLQIVEVAVDHAEAGRLEHELRARAVSMLGVEYAERATLRVAVPAGELDSLAGVLGELTGGTASATPTGTSWVDVSA